MDPAARRPTLPEDRGALSHRDEAPVRTFEEVMGFVERDLVFPVLGRSRHRVEHARLPHLHFSCSTVRAYSKSGDCSDRDAGLPRGELHPTSAASNVRHRRVKASIFPALTAVAVTDGRLSRSHSAGTCAVGSGVGCPTDRRAGRLRRAAARTRLGVSGTLQKPLRCLPAH